MQRLVEIRSYKLKPGSGARFHDLVVSQSMPLVRSFGMDVVTFGPSVHDPDAYFLVRAYDSIVARRRRLSIRAPRGETGRASRSSS